MTIGRRGQNEDRFSPRAGPAGGRLGPLPAAKKTTQTLRLPGGWQNIFPMPDFMLSLMPDTS